MALAALLLAAALLAFAASGCVAQQPLAEKGPQVASAPAPEVKVAQAPQAAPGQDQFVFAVFGDNRPDKGVAVSPVFPRLVQDMAEQRPEFIIGLGDYIAATSDREIVQQQWTAFFAALAPLQQYQPTRVALAPGNHDILGSAAYLRLFIQYFRRDYLSFDRGDCHFIVLDTCAPDHEDALGDKQWQWLQADLEANKDARLIFVADHEPLFPVAEHRGSSLDKYPAQRDALHALFVKYRVSCVFSGHEHVYHHERRDGVDYVISGGAGAPLGGSKEAKGFYHYLLVTVRDGGYSMRIRQAGG